MGRFYSPTNIIWCTVFLLGILQSAAVNCAEDVRQSSTYCVRPEHDICPEWCEECQTLDWFVNKTAYYFRSNAKMLFLSGEHYLSLSGSPVSVRHVSNFTLEGNETMNFDPNDDNPALNSRVICKHPDSGLLFLNSTELTIRRLAFIKCGVNVTFTSDSFSVQAAIIFRTSNNVTLFQVLITNSTGYGLHVDRGYDSFSIQDSAFIRSRPPSDNISGGNVRFWYFNESHGTTLNIENSSFKYGLNVFKHKNYPDGSGLSLIINAPLIKINIRKINASFNHAHNGANVAITISDFSKDMSTISIQDSFIGYGVAKKGAGLMYFIKQTRHRPEYGIKKHRKHIVVSVSKTEFYGNEAETGGAVYIHQHEIGLIGFTYRKILFISTTFINNTQTSDGSGSAVAIIQYKVLDTDLHKVLQFTVDFQNCNFTYNYCNSSIVLAKEGSVMAISGVEKVLIENSSFSKNNASALLLISSSVIFKGNITFEKNCALYGAAIKLCERSTIYLNKTYIKFVKNFANFLGGAIYVDQSCADADPPCFYQPVLEPSNVSHLNVAKQLEFINNTALIAGKALYGGSVDFCYTVIDFPGVKNNNTVFDMITDLSQQPGPSKVTSDPYGVCFCNHSTNDSICSETEKSVHLYPGEHFIVYASAVGQMNGVVPSMILLTDVNQTQDTLFHPHFIPNYNANMVLCHKVQITIFTTRPSVILEFSVAAVNMAGERGLKPRKINQSWINPRISVSLKMCPWIFELNKNKCDCPNFLLENDADCDINTVSFSHTNSTRWVWIGCEESSNSSNRSTGSLSESVPCENILYSKSCFKEYCVEINGRKVWSPLNLSAQCSEGREGRICGACKSNYSLSLGISKCLPNSMCSTWMLILLLLIFSISGLLLVFLLTFFNITVSDGTLYGILFYANIVYVNSAIFFSEHLVENILRIFVAWVNLDFGFEVCFYAGMDAYQKIWLEFAFLLYMLVLGLLIIYTSHKYIRVTRLVGRNVVGVLSTIMLFSYSKLVGTSVKALSFRYLHIYNSSKILQTILVWREDANINYFQGKHIPLAIVAILLCTISLFYTLSLLFIQCLQRRSNWFILRWVEKLRPFFDANTGPCRDNYRFWPGFILFSRFILCWFYSAWHPHFKENLYSPLLVCLFIFISACISPRGVYKKWPLNVLEFSSILNLGILSGLTVTFKDVHSIAFTVPSVGIFAMTFFCILVYQCYTRVKETKIYKKYSAQAWRRNHNQDPHCNIQDNERDEIVIDEESPLLQRIVTYNELRESLLESNTQN